jgi:hypothetical protein
MRSRRRRRRRRPVSDSHSDTYSCLTLSDSLLFCCRGTS